MEPSANVLPDRVSAVAAAREPPSTELAPDGVTEPIGIVSVSLERREAPVFVIGFVAKRKPRSRAKGV
jgi:hypothetical protein